MLIPPLVITAVLTSIANLRQVTNAARLAWQTLLWFAITSLAAVIVAMVVALVLKPGVNTTVDASAAATPSSQGSWLGFLQSIVPSNILGLTASASDSGVSLNFNILQILVLSIAFGIAAIQVGKKDEPIFELSASVLEVIQKVLWLSLIHI